VVVATTRGRAAGAVEADAAADVEGAAAELEESRRGGFMMNEIRASICSAVGCPMSVPGLRKGFMGTATLEPSAELGAGPGATATDGG
jgi:hypothetical protein